MGTEASVDFYVTSTIWASARHFSFRRCGVWLKSWNSRHSGPTLRMHDCPIWFWCFLFFLYLEIVFFSRYKLYSRGNNSVGAEPPAERMHFIDERLVAFITHAMAL